MALKRVLGNYSSAVAANRQRSFTYPLSTGSPVLFEIEYSGADEFKIFLVDSAGEEYERLLTPNRPRGPYEGVRALAYRDGVFEDHHENIRAFKIRGEGAGAWNVRVGLPDFDSPPITSAKGSGDHVIGPFALRSRNPFVTDFVFEITHEGGDFEARLIGSEGTTNLLVPWQDAPFENRKATVNVFAPWNPDKGPDGFSYDEYLLEIHADGEWAVRLLELVSEPTPVPREEISFKRVLGTYTGVGPQNLTYSLVYADVPGSPILFDIDFRGGGEFEVVLENALLQYERRLTPDPVVGPYRAVRALPYKDGLLDGSSLPRFNIHVEGMGAWEVKIGLPDLASPPITTAKGRGDHVVGPFVLTSEELSHADFLFEVTHAGANFEARLIASDGTAGYLITPQHLPFENKDVWVNLYSPAALGSTTGDLPYGEYVLAIQADGEWAVRLIEVQPEAG